MDNTFSTETANDIWSDCILLSRCAHQETYIRHYETRMNFLNNQWKHDITWVEINKPMMQIVPSLLLFNNLIQNMQGDNFWSFHHLTGFKVSVYRSWSYFESASAVNLTHFKTLSYFWIILANELDTILVKALIMSTNLLVTSCLQELEAEAVATRKCLEEIHADKFEFKPHSSSMKIDVML